jgi:hypothetical protein
MAAKTFAELQEQTGGMNLSRKELLALARTLKIEVPYDVRLEGATQAGCSIAKAEKSDRLFLVVPSVPYAAGGASRDTWVELSVAHTVLDMLQSGIEACASGDIEVPEGFTVECDADGHISYAKAKK